MENEFLKEIRETEIVLDTEEKKGEVLEFLKFLVIFSYGYAKFVQPGGNNDFEKGLQIWIAKLVKVGYRHKILMRLCGSFLRRDSYQRARLKNYKTGEKNYIILESEINKPNGTISIFNNILAPEKIEINKIDFEKLTEEERNILQWLEENYNETEIGNKLSLSQDSISLRIKEIRKKLETK